ncbi:PREDICTED: uncharacterized protein LOC105556359 [Vollenhovia emeryi]|uniref:uncharacterized protein LOC105556359 n=1 Tax=Vollenhovia emeryi TaxID=411798 RepID=UPI0005F3A8FE|nr:PREDICTED: uncharacterized protein LOC105556359 [Vollenhovia emeryi]
MTDILTKQTVLQRSIERAEENFKKIGRANLTPAKIRTRIASLKSNWAQFQDGHAHLLKTIAESDRAAMDYFQSDHFDNTEETFQSTWEYMTEALEELEPVVSANPSLDSSISRPVTSALSMSQLLQIRLPPFDGSYAEWENFRDRFTALIVKNKSHSDFARMHYLASSIKGRALDSISNIAVTSDNFTIAWSALKTRFENKRRLIASHFSSLLGLTGVARESVPELQALCNKVNIAVASLKGLNRTPSDLWNDCLVHLLSQKLDPSTRKSWNLKASDAETPPTYEELTGFFASCIRALEDSSPAAAAKPTKTTNPRVHVANASATAATACPLCKARHYLSACVKFTEQSPTQRRETVKRLKRCFNCLSAAHSVQDCKSQYTCRTCQKRHHTLLHVDSDSASSVVSSQALATQSAQTSAASTDVTSLLASATTRDRVHVLLATARVKISVSSGRSIVLRALIDQGSEATFISESLAQTLRAKRIRMPTTISAVGGVKLGSVRHAADISISPRDAVAPLLSTTALILDSLTSYAPKRRSDFSNLSHISNLVWADTDPTSSDPIHILIGADLYGDIILDGVKKGRPGKPIAQNSIFGWIISGPLSVGPSSSSDNLHLTVHYCSPSQALSREINRFWEIEEIPYAHVCCAAGLVGARSLGDRCR